MKEWLYERLPKGIDASLADSMLTSYGDTEEQARFFKELGVDVADASKFWPYQQQGFWKIGPGVVLGQVGKLDAEQQQQLGRYQKSGMSKLVGYQKIIDTITQASKDVKQNLGSKRIRNIPPAVMLGLMEAALYKPVSSVLDGDVTKALRSRDYVTVAANVTTNTAAPAQLANDLGERIVTAGSTVVQEDLVNSIMRNTARNETGVANYTKMNQIQDEQNGTKSYGILGLNSGKGTSGDVFVERYGEGLGLTAKIGTPEFDRQWLAATANNSDALLEAHEDYVSRDLIKPAQQKLTTSGLGGLNNDPGVISTVADTIVQLGPGLTDSTLRQVKELNADTPDQFFDSIEQVTVSNVDTNFETHLGKRPQDRAGLINRFKRRAQQGRVMSEGQRKLPRARSLQGNSAPVQTPEPVVARNNQSPTPEVAVNAPALEVVEAPELPLTSIQRELVPEILNSQIVSNAEDATLPPVFDAQREVDFEETILPTTTATEGEPLSLLDSLIPSDGSPPDVNALRNDPLFSEAPGNETNPLLTERSDAGRRQRALAELRQFPITEQRDAILAEQRAEAEEAVARRTLSLVGSLTNGGAAGVDRAGAALDSINANVSAQGSATNADLRAASPRPGDIPFSGVNSLLNARDALADLDRPELQDARNLQATRTAVARENAGRELRGEPAITVQDTLPILAQADSLFNTITQNQFVRNNLELELAREQEQLEQIALAQEAQQFSSDLDGVLNTQQSILDKARDPTAFRQRFDNFRRGGN